MPKKYTDAVKLNAIKLLVESFGDTTYVATQTGISARTLQYWKDTYRLKATIQVDEPENADDKHIKEQYRFLRQKIFTQIGNLFQYMDHVRSIESITTVTPSITRLIDRMSKLEEMVTDKDFTLKIEWVNPILPPPEEDISDVPNEEEPTLSEPDSN